MLFLADRHYKMHLPCPSGPAGYCVSVCEVTVPIAVYGELAGSLSMVLSEAGVR